MFLTIMQVKVSPIWQKIGASIRIYQKNIYFDLSTIFKVFLHFDLTKIYILIFQLPFEYSKKKESCAGADYKA